MNCNTYVNFFPTISATPKRFFVVRWLLVSLVLKSFNTNTIQCVSPSFILAPQRHKRRDLTTRLLSTCLKSAQAGERIHFNGSWRYSEATEYTAAQTTIGSQNGAAAALHHPPTQPGDAAADITFTITPFVSLQFYNHFYVVDFLQSTFRLQD